MADAEVPTTEAPPVLDAAEITRRLITLPDVGKKPDPAMGAILAPHLKAEVPESTPGVLSGSSPDAEVERELGWREKIEQRVEELGVLIKQDEVKIAKAAAALASELGGKVTLKVNDEHLFTDIRGNITTLAEEKSRQEKAYAAQLESLRVAKTRPGSSAIEDILHESGRSLERLNNNRFEAGIFREIGVYMEELFQEDNAYRSVKVLQQARDEIERDLQRARWSHGETKNLEAELEGVKKRLGEYGRKVPFSDPNEMEALEAWVQQSKNPLQEELLQIIKTRQAEIDAQNAQFSIKPLTSKERDDAKKRLDEVLKKLEETSEQEKKLRDKPPEGVILGPHGGVLKIVEKDEKKPDMPDVAPSVESSKPRFDKTELVPLENTAISPPVSPPGPDSGGVGTPPEILPPPPGGSEPPSPGSSEGPGIEPPAPTREGVEAERVDDLRHRVGLAADNYILAKRNARSWWRNFTGFLGGLAGGQTPDQRMTQARQEYEGLRNEYLSATALGAARAIGSETSEGYRQALAEFTAEGLIDEMRQFSRDELEFNERGRVHRILSGIYRNKAARTAIGIALNLGLGVSVVSGALPLTAALVAARVGFGAVGIEGALHGSQDFLSGRLGQRREMTDEQAERLNSDQLTRRIASFDEDRVRKGNRALGYTEEDLQNAYQERIRLALENRLTERGVTTKAETAGAVLLGVLRQEGSNYAKDRALVAARRWGLARWGTAFLLSGALTALTFHGTVPHPQGQETPGVGGDFPINAPRPPDFSTVRFDGADQLYSQIGQPDISSSWGFAQQQIAERIFGMSNFDPNNVDQLARFDELWTRDPARFSKMAVNLTDFMRQYNPGLVNGDLIKHAVNINVPANLTAYLNNINL